MSHVKSAKWATIGAIRGFGYGLIISSLILIMFYMWVTNMSSDRVSLGDFLSMIEYLAIMTMVVGVVTTGLSIKLAIKNVKTHRINSDRCAPPIR